MNAKLSWRNWRIGRRRLATVSGGAVGLAVLLSLLVWQFGAAAARPLVRAKLQAMIAEQLNAELQMGDLDYLPPYGVRVRDARLVTPGPDGRLVELFKADRLELKLARLPIRSPLVIQSAVIDRPSVHLIQTSQGLVGRRLAGGPGLVKDVPADQRKAKLSEMFELRHLALAGGQLVYDDRTAPGAVPVVWKDLDVDLRTAPQSGGVYSYHLTAADGAVTSLDARGTLLLDDLLLKVDACSVRAKADPAAATSPLPAGVQQVVRDYEVAGTVAVDVSGDVPLADPSAAALTATIDMADGRGRLPGADAPLDRLAVRLTATTGAASGAGGAATRPTTGPAGTPPPPLLRVRVDSAEARGGTAVVRLSGGNLILNGATGGWGLTGLAGSVDVGTAVASALPRSVREGLARAGWRGGVDLALNGSGPLSVQPDTLRQVYAELKVVPRDVAVQPPGFDGPLTEWAEFSVRLADGAATVGPVRARYHNDVLFLKSARVPLAGLPRTVRLEQVAGAVTFDRQPGRYPPPVADVVAQLNPRGPFFYDGWLAVDFDKPAKDGAKGGGPAVDYEIRLTTDRGAAAVAVGGKPVNLTNIKLEAVVVPSGVEVRRLFATAFTGTLSGTGRVTFGDTPGYRADVRLEHVDLNELGQLFVKPGGKPVTVSGEVNGTVRLEGAGAGDAALDNLKVDGRLAIAKGELAKIPLMKSVADALGIGDDLTVGEASSRFAVAKREVVLTGAMVSAPALGIEGAGTITLDGRLGLSLVASRLSRIDATPGGLLYRVRVTGTLDDPAAAVVFAPELSQTVGDLFRRVHESLRDEAPRSEPPRDRP